MQRSTVGSLLRSTQAACGQICEKQTLELGIAYYSDEFAALPDANQFREVIADDPQSLPQAFEEASQWFEQRGLTILRWAPASGTAAAATIDFLKQRGFRPRTSSAMILSQWIDVEAPAEVRVLPARAMRAALRETFPAADQAVGDGPSELGQGARSSRVVRTSVPLPDGRGTDSLRDIAHRDPAADACERRMDDPQYDMFVAMVAGFPAGRCALYQVGDIARVMDLTVGERFSDAGVDRALIGHVLAMARRLAMRNICVQVDEDQTATRGLLEQAGFVADGSLVEFDRRGSDHAAPARDGDST